MGRETEQILFFSKKGIQMAKYMEMCQEKKETEGIREWDAGDYKIWEFSWACRNVAY